MPDSTALRLLLISDANLSNLAPLLSGESTSIAIEVAVTPFGQLMQVLGDPNHPSWQPRPDATLVWSRPEAISAACRSAIESGRYDIVQLAEEVDRFADLLRGIRARTGAVLVPTWTTPPGRFGQGMLEHQPGAGLAGAVARMNVRLADRLAGIAGIHVLDAQRWIAHAGVDAVNPKLWYMGKIPFGPAVLKAAAADIRSSLIGLRGGARKLVIVDLDDTLWGGIVGEVGIENLRLGGHDPIGEAFADFQRGLRSLQRRGVLLGIASRNTEAIALEAIDRHPEMVLRRDAFSCWRIDWEDKAANIAAMGAELRLGLGSVVFIDDSAQERDRVRSALPEVLVPEWPEDKLRYRAALDALSCFNSPVFSAEDDRRTQLYAAERARQSALEEVGSIDDWLASLQTTVSVEPVSASNRVRCVQLLNKTNQMNLATRRMSEVELQQWVETDGHRALAFRVADRFGDAGLTGLACYAIEATGAVVTDFLLSCRVMGRRIEATMLHVLAESARADGLETLTLHYRETERNAPCRSFLSSSGLKSISDSAYALDLAQGYPLPAAIGLTYTAPR